MAPPLPPPVAPVTATQYGRNLLTEAIRIRRDTDDVMSGLWVLPPLLGFVAFIGFVIGGAVIGRTVSGSAGLLSGGAIGLVAGLAVYIILALPPEYKLIKRRSEHFRRDRMVREGLINYIRGTASERGIEAQMSIELATMITVHGEANGDENEESAVLWTILSMISFGLLGLHPAYFLTRDPQKHDARQLAFMQQVQSAYSKLQKTVVFPFWKTLTTRSFFLYLILSLLTFGLFALYWDYVLITDFNEHFRAQWQIEDQLLANF